MSQWLLKKKLISLLIYINIFRDCSNSDAYICGTYELGSIDVRVFTDIEVQHNDMDS